MYICTEGCPIIRPTLWIICKNLRASPAEMSFWSWCLAGTKHSDIDQVEINNSTMLTNHTSTQNLVRRIRSWRTKSSGQDFECVYWTISIILFWNLFTSKKHESLVGSRGYARVYMIARAHTYIYTNILRTRAHTYTCINILTHTDIGWQRLVGSLKWQVSCAAYRLGYRALLQKRPIILPYLTLRGHPLLCLCIYTIIYMYVRGYM